MIRRIEIDKSGGMLLLLGTRGAEEWFDFRPVPPVRIEPLQDPLIPLSDYIRLCRKNSDFEVLNYRPSRRLVVRESNSGNSTILKGFRRGRSSPYALKYELARSALDGGTVSASKVLDNNRDNDFLRFDIQPGRRPSLSRDKAGDFYLMGTAIRQLQSAKQDAGELETFSRDDEMAVLDERIRRLKLAGGGPPEGWMETRNLLEGVAATPALTAPVVAHRDLHDGQWLLHGGRGSLLDFDLLSLAEPELDPANFLSHLSLRRLQHPALISTEDEKACRQAFLEGLALPGNRDSRTRLDFYQATTFARLALVYQLRPRWRDIVPGLLDLGNQCLRKLARNGA